MVDLMPSTQQLGSWAASVSTTTSTTNCMLYLELPASRLMMTISCCRRVGTLTLPSVFLAAKIEIVSYGSNTVML